MIAKPADCLGCPLAGDMQGYVEDEIVLGAPVFILAQGPGKDEEAQGKPMVGVTGQQMDQHFLPLAGLERGKVSVGNVLKCRWVDESGSKTDTLPLQPLLDQAVAHCTTHYLRFPSETKLVISQGALGFKYLTGGKLRRANGKPATVTDWRGFLLPEQPIPAFQVLHIAGLDRQGGKGKRKGGMSPAMRWVAQRDWSKVPAVLRGAYPWPLPPRVIFTPTTLNETRDWFAEAHNADYIVLDTEYTVDTRYLTILGLLMVTGATLHGFQVNWLTAEPWMKATVRQSLHDLIKHRPFVMHNFQADVLTLQKNLDIPWQDWFQIDDSLQAHGVMWSEFPHDLEFLASIYGQYPKMKHLASSDPLLYNFGDVLDAHCVWQGVQKELTFDTQARDIYVSQQRPLIPIWLRSITMGLRVHRQRVLDLRAELSTIVSKTRRAAAAFMGRPFNLGSDDQLKDYLYNVLRLPLQVDKDTGNPTVDDEAVAVLRRIVGPPFDPETEATYESALERIDQGADPMLELRVVHATADHTLSNYILPLCNPTGVVDRIYPSIGMPQKTGRWAIVDPPISTLPARLRGIIIPNEGHGWVHWDWKSIELWFLYYLTGSKVLGRALNEGMDLPTWTACVLLGYPFPPNLREPHTAPENEGWRRLVSWRGKDDPRRIFAKEARFEINYGGSGANAAEAAGQYGLDPKVLKKAVQRLIEADVEYYAWRREVDEQVRKTRITRSFMGRPWVHLGSGQAIVREALDHPMQAGVADVAHTTMIMIAEKYPQLWFAWGQHDSQYWSVPLTMLNEGLCAEMKAIAERPFTVAGKSATFPADFGIIMPPEETSADVNA